MLSTIFTTFTLSEAHLVRARLEAAGFHPSLRNELASLALEGYTMAAGGLDVQVPPAEAEEARAFLQHSTPLPE